MEFLNQDITMRIYLMKDLTDSMNSCLEDREMGVSDWLISGKQMCMIVEQHKNVTVII